MWYSVIASSILTCITAFWLYHTATIIPEPYLDEIFHVRQTEQYWLGNWHIWDPKITTPPGLYVISIPWLWLLSKWSSVQTLPLLANFTLQLRSLNAVACALIFFQVVRLLRLLPTRPGHDVAAPKSSRIAETSANKDALVALNICLFPPLFFFYGLYYTDVISVLMVLCAYENYFKRKKVLVMFFGACALTFRQTNIFWVALFLGGLQVNRMLAQRQLRWGDKANPTYSDILVTSWQHARVHDPMIAYASFEDYIKYAISLGLALICSLRDVLVCLSPYLVLLGCFGSFVVWNGGVVLGDKDNHIASIHLPQMLYIWPYFMFFSFPILLPHLLNTLIPQKYLPATTRSGSMRYQLPDLAVIMPILAVMLATVHFNTLVHPFTLADNRHYIFYTFRILMQHPSIKYLVTPIYLICAWVALITLGELPVYQPPPTKHNFKNADETLSTSANRVSFVLIWLGTTTLSLITAPLVEPRYFIIPWLIWRLNVPSPPTRILLLETAWFLSVNCITGYTFLYRGFEWPQEPGKVQRFMW